MGNGTMTWGLTALLGLSVAVAGQERGYYSAARLQVARRNLEQFEWARQQREQILKRAEVWLAYDDARLRTLVPPPEVPRDAVANDVGAPVKGAELKRQGAYSWVVSFEQPWKVTNPVDGAVYPSNDFAAFMQSGYRDRSLLTGPYPDDGWGCPLPGFAKPFWFVAVYAHWSVVRLLLPALEDLSRAYLLTDDPRYAHAGAVLLWQLAEYYPRYAYETQSRYGKEVEPGYLGRLLYHTWESLYTCQTTPPAYDAIRPAIANDAALAAMTGQAPERIRAHIEERLFRTMANDIMDGSGRIQGNYGMHQTALLKIAAVLRASPETPTSAQMVAWVLRNPQATNYTQIGIEDAVNNLLHRDGYPFESISYSVHWIEDLASLVEALGPDGQRILAMPRFKRLFEWPLRIAVAGEFTPSYGDSNHMFQSTFWMPSFLEAGFRLYRDPRFAKALVLQKASPGRDLFTVSLESELPAAAAQCKADLGVSSELLPGVGYASLQCGSPENRTGLALFYGYYEGHSHYDRLQLDLYSWRNALTPDFGYPETADSYDPRRFGFLSHTVAHNTVMIDSKRQEPARGRLCLYDPGAFAQTVEVAAEADYPGVATLYRRTLMLVEVSPQQAYIVDIFRVRGGRQHDWIVHGTQAEFASGMPFSAPRQEGTLAGAQVAYGSFYDDARYADNNQAHVPYYEYKGSAYQWLFNVQEAALNGVGVADWKLNRPENLNQGRPNREVVLRAHLVGQGETVFACDGVPQRRETWPATVKFLVRRRAGEGLESCFVTVFEPYKTTPFIAAVRALPVAGSGGAAVALDVTLVDGRKHLVFNRIESSGQESSVAHVGDSITLNARAAVLEQDAAAAVGRVYLLDDEGSRVPGVSGSRQPGRGAVVQSIDYGQGAVTLSAPILAGPPPAGGVVIVESPGHANVVAVAAVRAGNEFAVGDEDLAAGTVQVTAVDGPKVTFSPKYVYFIEPGMTLVNESGKVVGRLVSTRPGQATVSRDVTLEDFPDLDQDGRRTCRAMVIGPGDTVTGHAAYRRTRP